MMKDSTSSAETTGLEIAIVGMAVRLPGARDVAEFWQNLRRGKESITFFSDDELKCAGIDPSLIANPNYVGGAAVLDGIELFDAAFFGFNPKEAGLLDPQHRLFLECAWEAIEDAGYTSDTYKGAIGVYAGASHSNYSFNVHSDSSGADSSNAYQILLRNGGDFVPTRVSYKLNLQGPSINVQTGCSTSLVAVHLASQGLLNGECDMALAGGVSASVPRRMGYLYQEGMINSPDGHCRAFDAKAKGTIGGEGVGVVVLKRLADAMTDGDTIYAIIKGSAINNDGSQKVGFTAPSVDGQAKVIRTAHVMANVDPESITYVEGHGTGTELGDPIEVAALTKAFRARTTKKRFCSIGSVKTNVGHLDVAAGVAGLIKTVLALKHKQLPPSLHFEKPNPKIDFDNSPFFVQNQLSEWPPGATPRRAGVSSFGIGGTNAHVVLEEAPARETVATNRMEQLIVLSAKTPGALEEATKNLACHLQDHPELHWADAAYTLQSGRRVFEHRRMVVCRDAASAVNSLSTGEPERVLTRHIGRTETAVAFMFPGQGAQYINMGKALYDEKSLFYNQISECAELLLPQLGLDIRAVLYPDPVHLEVPEQQINQTFITQPLLFAIEYSLAKLWMQWGIQPRSMIGHSLGEYVAASLAGVFSRDEALLLLAARARLMQSLPPGAMLAVRLPTADLEGRLGNDLSIAAINSPSLTVISGGVEQVQALADELTASKVPCRRLATSHAFHSQMLDSILGPFGDLVRRLRLNPPQIPWVSSLTGDWVTAAQATDPNYWVQQLRQPVRFADGLRVLLQEPNLSFLEVGPGQALSTLARQHPDRKVEHEILSSLHTDRGAGLDVSSMLHSLGRLWLAGTNVDWAGVHDYQPRQRIALPTYPFERKRFWVSRPEAEVDNGKKKEEGLPVMDSLPAVNQNELAVTNTDHTEFGQLQSHNVGTENTIRRDNVLANLQGLFSELSGIDVTEMDQSMPFLELGLDSLLLTQASATIQKQFGVKVTFRQLLEELSNLKALADHLSPLLPEEPSLNQASILQEKAAQLTPFSGNGAGKTVNVHQPVNASPSTLEQIFAKQLELMSRQLDMLQTGREVEPATRGVNGGAALHNAIDVVATRTPLMSGDVQEHPYSRPLVCEQAKPSTPGFGPYKPIIKDADRGLTPRQREYLDALIARYTARTRESKRLTSQHRPHLADPRTVAGFRLLWKELVYPIVTERSAGSRLWDVDGNEYVDLTSGFGAILFGHAPTFVTHAIEEQLQRGMEIGPQSPLAGRVAQLLCELTGMDRAAFCNTGSEAVLAALRIARTVTGREKVAMFSGDYHGIFDEVVVRSVGTKEVPKSRPAAPGIPVNMAENVIVLEYGSPKSLEILRAHAHELAAVIVEPVQSRRLDLQPKEFLQELRELTAQSGTALIFDEMVTGFRAHQGGAQALFGIKADIATYGKVIGGGLPIGVVAGKAAFMDALDGGMWNYGDNSAPEVGMTFFAGTFVRHPLVLAAAWACLNHLKEQGPDLQLQLNQRTQRLVEGLTAHTKRMELPVRVTHFSSLFSLEFSPDLPYANLFYAYMRDKGIHMWEGRVGVLTTAHADKDVDRIIDAFKESVAEMQEAGFLPAPPNAPEAMKKPHNSDAETPPSYPLTDAQRELWLATRMGDDSSRAFVDSVALHLHGPFQIEAMVKAIQQLVERHDSLRSTFTDNGEERVVAASIQLDVPLIDLSGLAQSDQPDRLAEIGAEESRELINLAKGPLLRSRIVKLQDEYHVVFLSTHHIAVDGWSLGVLLSELGAIYSAESNGKPHELPAARQFFDYQAWEEDQRQNGVRAASETYWLEQFKEPIPILELPVDRPRPEVKTYTAGRQQMVLPSGLCQDLRRLAARQGSTPFATLLAAFNALLYRLTGGDDIVVGIPAAGQLAFDAPDLVGHCVNFLPVRNRINSSSPFSEHLATVKNLVLEAYDHQNYTYGSLLEKLKLPRDPSRLPLVSVSFNLDRVRGRPDFGNLDVEVAFTPRSSINFDCQINIDDTSSDTTVNWQYNTDLFTPETVQRWLHHYRTLLEGIVSKPDQTVSALPLLTGPERQQLLVEWNETKSDYPKDKCVHELFEAQAGRSPDAVAVVFEGRELTYGELNRRANLLAHYLCALGVGPDVPVGICMDRSLEMIIALLGTLKAGGAYVPLDPGYPKDRMSFMIKDAKVAVLLTQRRWMKMLPEHGSQVFCLDPNWERLVKKRVENPVIQMAPGNLAYVVYTSGSTGRPKGVEVPHRGITRLLLGVDYVQLDATQTFCHLAPTSFDAATFELWGALLHGAKCVLYPGAVPTPVELGKVLHQNKVSILWLTASLFNTVIDEAPEALSEVRRLLIGGESLSVKHVRRALDLLPETQIINCYGPTESTTFTSCYPIPRQLDESIRSVPIGRPISNTQVYILDSRLEPVPVGVPGELYIGGDGLARGYLNCPELTAERFIANPFGHESGERLYKTGDLVRYQACRNIEFLERIDNQVKIRGFRVEPGEIEAFLGRYPGVRDKLVIAQEDILGDKRLVAYVLRNPGHDFKSRELRNFLKRHLPEYMVPSAFVFLDSLPLTPNGKVDYRALPDARYEDMKECEYVGPRDETERVLCRVWSEVLGVDAVGLDDNFFAIGGHSLLAARLCARLDEEFGRSLSLGVLFTAPTIRLLAECYRTSAGSKGSSILVPLSTGGSLPPVFAVPGVFGNVVGFEALARELGSEQPFYRLQSVGLDGTEAPLDSIGEMARLFLTEMRSVHPGPYAILGACFGATVAYEMTRQLLEGGEEVAFLGLLGPTDREGNPEKDNLAPVPRVCRRAMALGNIWSNRLGLYLEEMQGLSSHDRIKYLTSKIFSLGASIADKNHLQGAQRELNQIEVYRANLVALDCYHRKSLHGRLRALEVFQPVRLGTDVQEPIDWNEFWKGCTKVHRVGGQDSGDMLSGKNVRVIAALLKERLIAAFADDFGTVRRIKEAKQELTPTSPGAAG